MTVPPNPSFPFAIQNAKLLGILKSLLPAMSKDTTRPWINGLHISNKHAPDGQLDFVTTNGHTLARYRLEDAGWLGETPHEFSCTLLPSTVKTIVMNGYLKKNNSAVTTFALSSLDLSAEFENTKWCISHRADETFPNWTQVVPKDYMNWKTGECPIGISPEYLVAVGQAFKAAKEWIPATLGQRGKGSWGPIPVVRLWHDSALAPFMFDSPNCELLYVVMPMRI